LGEAGDQGQDVGGLLGGGARAAAPGAGVGQEPRPRPRVGVGHGPRGQADAPQQGVGAGGGTGLVGPEAGGDVVLQVQPQPVDGAAGADAGGAGEVAVQQVERAAGGQQLG